MIILILKTPITSENDISGNEETAWAEPIGITPREVQFRAVQRKWASCSSRGRLTFYRGLLEESAEFRAEVIVHELVHLKVPNHGPLFKQLVQAYLAMYRTHNR